MRLVPARRDTKLAQARSVSFKSQENKTSERRRRVCCASWAELFANSDGGIRLLKRTRSAKKQASSSLVSTILVVFVDRAAGPESVERESKRDIIRDIDKLTSHLPLHDHIADVSTSTNGCIIKRGHLPGLPSDQEIAVVDGAFRSQQSKRPSLMAAGRSLDRHHALHRVDAVGQRSIIEEGPSARRVVANIRIATIIPRIWVAWDEHSACREAMSKSFERFQSRRNEPQLLSG